MSRFPTGSGPATPIFGQRMSLTGPGRLAAAAMSARSDESARWLARRLAASLTRLQQPDYAPEQVMWHGVTGGWPGDYPGRLILGLSHLARTTGREPASLQVLVDQLPRWLNQRGYLGPVHDGVADEQQLAGHGWLVSGLLAHHELTGSDRSRERALTIVDELFLPTLERLGSYPRHRSGNGAQGSAVGAVISGREGWRLSSDTFCVLISLEGLVAAFGQTRNAAIASAIEQLTSLVEHLDLVGSGAQLHASLTAGRCLHDYHRLTGDERALSVAKAIYATYANIARTVNDAPYNWFGRADSWTEACATVDSFLLATGLWRTTRQSHYLDDAHRILFNGLGYAQKVNGGFGCDTCANTDRPVLSNSILDAAWCCTMRGAVGLSAATEAAYDVTGDHLHLGLYQTAQTRVAFGGGTIHLMQDSDYPFIGKVVVDVEQANISRPGTMHFHLPSWAKSTEATLCFNGRPVADRLPNQLMWHGLLGRGDRFELVFPVKLHIETLGHTDTGRPLFRALHGPLLLGDAISTSVFLPTAKVGPTSQPGVYQAGGRYLRPVHEVFEAKHDQAPRDQRRVVFEEDLHNE